MKLTAVRSKDADGNPVVMPHIDGYEIWEIPAKHWTGDVQLAIVYAYGLGWDMANEAVRKAVKPLPPMYSAPVWEEEIE